MLTARAAAGIVALPALFPQVCVLGAGALGAGDGLWDGFALDTALGVPRRWRTPDAAG